jgi:hypothetical protein
MAKEDRLGQKTSYQIKRLPVEKTNVIDVHKEGQWKFLSGTREKASVCRFENEIFVDLPNVL